MQKFPTVPINLQSWGQNIIQKFMSTYLCNVQFECLAALKAKQMSVD